MSAWIVQLDRALAQYGSEAHELRNLLQQIVASRIHEFRQGFSEKDLRPTLSRARGIETIQNQLLNLTPQNDAQRWFKATALDISNHIAETRWMGIFNADRTIQIPFLFVLTFWLAAIFKNFGIFAPRNGNVIAAVVICALSVAGAIFLIVEMDQPVGRFVRVTIAPLQAALDQLNKP